jgi:hypothetical protein
LDLKGLEVLSMVSERFQAPFPVRIHAAHLYMTYLTGRGVWKRSRGQGISHAAFGAGGYFWCINRDFDDSEYTFVYALDLRSNSTNTTELIDVSVLSDSGMLCANDRSLSVTVCGD